MTAVRAAGGVVWRPAQGTVVEVCLVHRPRYDDWSLPKGKLEPGEHPLLAAVREVAEEADVRAVPQVRLPEVRYATRDGLPKTVDYWSMRMVDNGGFQPHTEVDALRWLPVEEAAELASYAHDVRVLREFAALPPVTAVLTLVRPGGTDPCGTRSGPDTAGELDAIGTAQARALAPLLTVNRPERLLSASARRCVQMIGPLAELLDLPIEVDSAFDEPDPGRNAEEAGLLTAARLAGLAATGIAVAVCGQGTVIPESLARLVGGDCAADYATPAGTGWLLAFTGDRLVATDRLICQP